MERCAAALLASACMVAFPHAARAQGATRQFQLAAGPASVSVPELGRQGGVRILANGEDLAGIATNAVNGVYGAGEALDMLLAGTGLAARRSGNGTLLIHKRAPAAAGPAPAMPLPAVHVVGLRASQQTSIERKINAETAIDSIVAEDVGTFPDRNAAEAISRIAGVTLERAEYGEGTTLNVRGTPARFTRVEIDGLGVLAAGGTDLNNSGGGRGVELRELSTDLIKSIDVVKGATADMSEGSLGGSIIIRSRTGFDFDKRFVSARVAAQANSINRKWAPNLNLIFADKFLDKRLGVIFNLTKSDAYNENHTMAVSSVDAGMTRSVDFDQSPEKTFSYNPSTVSKTDPAATAPLARWAAVGGGMVDSLSPLEIVTRSAAAVSKAGCHAAFPFFSSAELAAISAATGRAAAQSQRAGELQSCLNQWNDSTPRNLRYQMRREHDRRLYADLRFDFKASDKLSVYAKFNRNTRAIDDDQLFFGQGGISINPAGSYVDSGAAPNITRTPVAGSGYYFYPTRSNRGANGSTYLGLSNGSVVNVDPSSVVVDANHHVTEYKLSNTSANSDQIYDQIESSSRYAQVGGSWRSGALRADFLAGRVAAHAARMQWRTNFSIPAGPATVSISPEGWWTYSRLDAYDQKDYANYGTLLAPAASGLPRMSGSTQLTLTNPRIMERTEDTARLDMAYGLGERLPYLSRIKFGANLRNYLVSSWSGAGYTAQSGSGLPAVVVPRVALGSSFAACENTSASLASGGRPCAYGTTYSSNPATAFNSSIVMTQAAYREIVAQALTRDTITYFNSLPGRPAQLVRGWTEIDVRKVIEATGVAHFNLDCVKFCIGSDGKIYEQPRTGVNERVMAGYVSSDFAFDRIPFSQLRFPFGWELEGNFGWRLVRTDVAATGLMGFQSITTTGAYDPLNPGAASGIASATLTRNTTLRQTTTDVMPILNLAWWAVKNRVVLRYSKAKAIARPPVEYLYSNAVSCTYDQRRLASGAAQFDDNGENMSCDGTIGNPSLRALSNRNYNLSAEWYPNKDTVLSLSGLRQRGIVGGAQRVAVTDAHPFAGSGALDPASGADLSGAAYSYATYVNGPAADRKGFELGGKTAFTFLPRYLRHTGLDANYTRVRSRNVEGAIRDLISGDEMAPVNEMKYTWNASLWYDDGRLRARVALQGAASFFRGLPEGVNNYPANGITGSTSLPLNPGSPTFRDASRFIDAKISYRFDNGVELFAEGRNLGRSSTVVSNGSYLPFAKGTPNLLDYGYYGAQYMVGVTLRR
ncbi:MAG: TonB-dependent receptor [Pseudomonadota bacterium]